MNTLNPLRLRAACALLMFSAALLTARQVRAESCDIHLSQAQLNFGKQSSPEHRSAHDGQRQQAIGTRYVTLNVVCVASTRLMLGLRGESLGEQFRFAEQGQLQVRLSGALLDGQAVELAVLTSPEDVPNTSAAAVQAAPGNLIVPVSGGRVVEGTLWSMQVEVSPSVPLEAFSTRDRKALEGQVSFNLREF